MTRGIIERLPKLRLIASTATRNASIDLKAAEERGVQIVHTGYTSAPTIELTWALILGSARNLVATIRSARCRTCWQRHISATSPAAFTLASTRIRSRTSAAGSTAKQPLDTRGTE